MFKFNYLVLATLVCTSAFAGSESKKSKKSNLLKRTAIAGVVGASSAIAFSLYQQRNFEGKPVLAKIAYTPHVLIRSFKSMKISERCTSLMTRFNPMQLVGKVFGKKPSAPADDSGSTGSDPLV